jgi:hypothetical protein
MVEYRLLWGVTSARRDNVGCGNKEYYLCNLYNGTRVENIHWLASTQRVLTEGFRLRRSKYHPSPPSTISHLYALTFGVGVRPQVSSSRLPPEPVRREDLASDQGSFLTILYKSLGRTFS